jgi:steroid delta-isomerase
VDERMRKELAVEHCRRINARDADGVARLYAEDVCFEDPVGTGVRSGREALRGHAAGAILNGVHEFAHDPVAALDDAHAAVVVTATMNYARGAPILSALGYMDWDGSTEAPGKVIQIRYVMQIRVNRRGLIDDMKAFWGRSDVSIIDKRDAPVVSVSR